VKPIARQFKCGGRVAIGFALTVLSISLATSTAAAPNGESCELASATNAGDLRVALGRRAAELVQHANGPSWRSDPWLKRLVAPKAQFDLGAGDVRRPLGEGPEGIHLLAKEMHANTYRYMDWNYIPMHADPCASQAVSVEFVDGPGKTSSNVEFRFENGRVVGAKGWTGSFESGPLN
jgi:hypothetical protein